MKHTTLFELAAGLNNCTNSTRFKAWEKGDNKRIYVQGAGYNTKKMSTKAWIDCSGEQPKMNIRIECFSQPQQWIDSQEAELATHYEAEVRYCRRFFNFNNSTKSVEVVMNNALLAAEPVKGYYTEWRHVRVAINSFGKLADRNRQFVVPFQGTKDNAPRTFVELEEKGFAYLRGRGEVMLDAYEAVPDFNERADFFEKYKAEQAERSRLALLAAQKAEDAKIAARQEQMTKISQGLADGTDILSAWKAAGCPHPAPAEVAEAKKASGLNWNNFTASIQ
jgi:hypothetical protein